MKQSESITKLTAALVKAQTDITNLFPSSKGYGYTYVPLEKIIDLLKEVLPKHGLGYIQLPCEGDAATIGLSTRIVHESGEWLEETAVFPLTDMKGVNKSQMTGAALTYFRRYALCAAFGITGDSDVDASDKAFEGKSSHAPQQTQRQQAVSQWTEKQVQEASMNLQGFIDNGALDKQPNWKNRAISLIKEGNLDGMLKCIEYCKSQELAS